MYNSVLGSKPVRIIEYTELNFPRVSWRMLCYLGRRFLRQLVDWDELGFVTCLVLLLDHVPFPLGLRVLNIEAGIVRDDRRNCFLDKYNPTTENISKYSPEHHYSLSASQYPTRMPSFLTPPILSCPSNATASSQSSPSCGSTSRADPTTNYRNTRPARPPSRQPQPLTLLAQRLLTSASI